VKNRKCGQVTSHCRKARPYRADLSLFLNVPVVTVKSEITVRGRLVTGRPACTANIQQQTRFQYRQLDASGY